MNRLNRVVFVVTTLGHGGADGQVVALAEQFADRGWIVGIISLIPPERTLESLDARGIRVTSLGMRRRVPDPRAVVRLARLIRSWKPQVVHSHMVHANLLARLTRLVAPMPVLISTGHNANEGTAWRYAAYRMTDWLADVTTNVSRAAVDEATRRGAAKRGRIRFVPNGVDLEVFKPDAPGRSEFRQRLNIEDEFVWLWAGRMTAAKDLDTLLVAYGSARAANSRSTLLLAGTGPDEGRLRDRIIGLGLVDSVRLLGPRDDIAALMQAADGFVLSSRWEGMPMVLLEASAVGLPSVTTDAGGSGEVVISGQTGWVVRIGEPDQLAARMRDLMLLDDAARLEMGRRARAHVSVAYGLDRVVKTWIDLYHEAAMRRQGERPS